MSISPANKKLFTVSIILYIYSKISPDKGILLKGAFDPKLLNNLLASCYLMNLNILLTFLMKLSSSFFRLYSFWVFSFCIFLHFKQYDNIVLWIYENLWWTFEGFRLLISFFVSSYSLCTIFTKTNSSWLIYELIKAQEIKTSILFDLVFASNTILSLS